jgi:Tol biopolymer transport system component
MRLNRLMQSMILAASLMAAQATKGDPEVLLRAAIEKESVDGDLKAAIQQYEKIARSGNRVAAAKALVRMGQCYEKLGDAEARKAYERTVREYGDQKDSAAAARARLAVLAGPRDAGQGVRRRLIWDQSARYVSNVSTDGRWVQVNVPQVAGVAIRNMQTGEQRTLKEGQAHHEGFDEGLLSPDGKQVVFLWWQWEAKEGAQAGYSLRTIRADGSGERILWDVGKESTYLMPRAWSADGKQIALRDDRGEKQAIVILEADSGKRRSIPMPAGTWPERMAFSADGRWLAASGYFSNEPRGRNVFMLDLSNTTPALRVVAERAQLVGYTPNGKGLLYTRQRGEAQELHLLPMAGGAPAGEPIQLKEAGGLEGVPLGLTPAGTLYYDERKVRADALVAGFDGSSLSIGEVALERASVSMGAGGRSGSIKLSRDGRRALIALSNGALLVKPLDGGAERTVLPQMEAAWHFEWAADGQSFLANGIGRDGKNGLYRVDIQTGASTLIMASGEKVRPFGRFALAPDGITVYWPGGEGTISALDLRTLAIRTAADVAWGELAEIRVSPDGGQLALAGENRVVLVDLATGRSRAIVERRGVFFGGDWSPDGRYLFTTFGEPDGVAELYRIPADGSSPQIKALPEHVRNVRLSPDGRSIAMTRWNQHRQVWALENFLPADYVSR